MPPFNGAASRRKDLTPPPGPTQDEWKKRKRPPNTWHQAGAPPDGDLLAERGGPSRPQRPRDELRNFSDGSNGHQPAEPAYAGNPPAALRGASDTSEGRELRQDRHDLSDRTSRQEREPLRLEVRGEIGSLIDNLRTIFERDRAVASQSGSTRCGICYLHYAQSELEYRDAEGFYVCPTCARALGTAEVSMVRRQQQ
jgi:hypothetical protein